MHLHDADNGIVENGRPFGALPGGVGVGTRGGSEDHVAILCARPGTLLQYAFRPARLERAVPLPDAHTFVIAASGVIAEKSGAALTLYNTVSDRARALEQLWHDIRGRADDSLGAAVASETGLERLRARLTDSAQAVSEPEVKALSHRLEQFAGETLDIIPAAGDALLRGDIAEFGRHVARSQDLAESMLGNQIAETMYLVDAARRHGAVAASAFGAGFGGSVWALIPDVEAVAFMRRWEQDYGASFPQHSATADFSLAPAGPGVVRLDRA